MVHKHNTIPIILGKIYIVLYSIVHCRDIHIGSKCYYNGFVYNLGSYHYFNESSERLADLKGTDLRVKFKDITFPKYSIINAIHSVVFYYKFHKQAHLFGDLSKTISWVHKTRRRNYQLIHH